MNYFCSNLSNVTKVGLNECRRDFYNHRSHFSHLQESTLKSKYSKLANAKNALSPLEVHRLKQREQYKNMLTSLNKLIAVLPTNSKIHKTQTKQVVLTECTRYIQYLLVVAWCLAKDCNKAEEDILPCLAWDGFCLNQDVLQMLNVYRPFTFKLCQTKRKGMKKSSARFQTRTFARVESCPKKMGKRRKKCKGKLKLYRANRFAVDRQSSTQQLKEDAENMHGEAHTLPCEKAPTISPGTIFGGLRMPKDKLLNSAACMSKSPSPFLDTSHENHAAVGNGWSMPDTSNFWMPEVIWESGSSEMTMLRESLPVNCHPAPLFVQDTTFYPPQFGQSLINPDCVSPLLESSFYNRNVHYQPLNDHNYGRSRSLAAPADFVSSSKFEKSVEVDVDDVLFSNEASPSSHMLHTSSGVGRNHLDSLAYCRNDEYFLQNQQSGISSGGSGSFIKSFGDLPLDLSLPVHSPTTSQYRTNSQASQSSSSRNSQSLEFSPRMFLNILPKQKSGCVTK